MTRYCISRDDRGLVLFETEATDPSQALDIYRRELGAEAFSYDSADPFWMDCLTVELIEE